MEHELAGEGLQTAGSAFDDFVVDFGRTDRLYVQPIRRIADGRKLHGTVLGERRIELARARLSGPADRPAVQVMGVHDLGTADHAELGRIAEIGTGNRGRRIAERIGAVALGFVGEPDQMRLQLQPLAVRFAAIVQQAGGGPIGVRMRVSLGQHVALAIQQTERFVTGLVIEDDEFAEVGAVRHIDHGLPPALHLLRREGAEIAGPARLDHERTQHAERVLISGRVAMERAAALLQIDGDVPFELAGLPRGHQGIRVIGGRRLARARDEHLRAVDDHVRRFAGNLVAQGDPKAIPLVRPDDQRLDQIALQPVRDRAAGKRRVFTLPSRLVLRFFLAHARHLLGQRIHVARIEIAEPVDGNFHVHRRHVVGTDRCVGRAAGPLGHLHFFRILRDEEHALLHRVGPGPLERTLRLDLPLDLLDGLGHLVLQHRTGLRMDRGRQIGMPVGRDMRVVRHGRQRRHRPCQPETGRQSYRSRPYPLP